MVGSGSWRVALLFFLLCIPELSMEACTRGLNICTLLSEPFTMLSTIRRKGNECEVVSMISI